MASLRNEGFLTGRRASANSTRPRGPNRNTTPLDIYEVALLDGLTDSKIDSDWWNHLSSLVDKEVIEEHGDAWPSSHEFISDMMVVRIEDELEEFAPQIAEAKLNSHLIFA